MKEEIKQLREEIAALEKEQINMKAQRKTVYLKVERTVTPYDAAEQVRRNKEQLRTMYAAYGLMRGKTFIQIENRYDTENNDIHPLYGYCKNINKILNKYGYDMEHEEKENYWGQKIQTFKKGCDEKIVRIDKQEA